MQPQTIAVATWLLYFEGAFTFLFWLDGTEIHGFWRQVGGPFALVAFLSIVAFPMSGFLMANGKKLGWYIGLGAAFSPFFLRLVWKIDNNAYWSWQYVVVGRSYFNFLFEAALCALLLHNMSRRYVTTWLR